MRRTTGIGLGNVQAVYAGPEGKLWEPPMGELGFVRDLAYACKIAQGLFVARKEL